MGTLDIHTTSFVITAYFNIGTMNFFAIVKWPRDKATCLGPRLEKVSL